MSIEQLTAFEQSTVAALSYRAGLAAILLRSWAGLPATSVQTARTLVAISQLGLTDEQPTTELLQRGAEIGLLIQSTIGFRPASTAHGLFERIAFALSAVDFYQANVHRDITTATAVLTRPPRPSRLEKSLADVGWRSVDIEPTEHAFRDLARSAKRRLVVMTPFFDAVGATWLHELFSCVVPSVRRILILRSLESPTRSDFPSGMTISTGWLRSLDVQVFNYSIPREEGAGRETFHAKVVLCDQSAAYVGSSNMTMASLEYSMEMGILVKGRAASDVSRIVDAVLASSRPHTP